MALISSLVVQVKGDSLDAQKALLNISKTFKSVVQSATGVATALAGLSVGAAVAGIVAITKNAMEFSDKIGDSADALGVTTAALSKLEYAAKFSNIEAEDLNGALAKMNNNLADVALTGQGGAAAALARLGLSANALTGMLPDQAFKLIADRISKIENVSLKTSTAMDIFGKQGAKFVGFLSKGSAGINALEHEADTLGATLNDIDAAKINQTNDAIDKLAFFLRGVGQTIAAEVSPYIKFMIDDFIAANTAGKTMGETVRQIFQTNTPYMGYFLDVLQNIKGMLAAVGTGALYVAEVVIKLVAAVSYLGDLVGITEGLGNSLVDVAADVRAAADAMYDYTGETFYAQSASSRMTDYFAQLELNANNATDAIDEQTTAIQRMAKAATSTDLQKAQEAGKALIESLEKQRDEFFLTGRALEIYKAAQKGADWDTLQKGWAIDAEIKELEAIKKMRADRVEIEKDHAEEVKKVLEGLMSPMDRYAQEVMRLGEIERRGGITHEEFLKARDKAKKDILGTGNNGAVASREINSAAAAGAYADYKNQRIGGPKEDTSKSILSEDKKHTTLLEKIEKALVVDPVMDYA